jgi:hypothetical protein
LELLGNLATLMREPSQNTDSVPMVAGVGFEPTNLQATRWRATSEATSLSVSSLALSRPVPKAVDSDTLLAEGEASWKTSAHDGRQANADLPRRRCTRCERTAPASPQIR